MKRGVLSVWVIASGIFPLFIAEACGPDFSPDVFVQKLRPDHPKDYASGKLGIPLPTYPREDLIVAFRYLNGGVLSPAEQQAYRPLYDYSDPEWQQSWQAQNKDKPASPVDEWKKARASYAKTVMDLQQDRPIEKHVPNGGTYTDTLLNCNGDAFRTAALTLTARAKTWGEQSQELVEWLKGQDEVFSNCGGGPATIPANVAESSPALLKADRAYQQAAANFYSMKYEDARRAFIEIGQDSASPWHGIAGYLAARCLVRDAFSSTQSTDDGTMAKFEKEKMRQAAALLESLLKEPHPGLSQQAIQNELDLVRLRIEPEARLKELTADLGGPQTDPNFDQHLKDLTFYLNAQIDQSGLREDSYEVEHKTEKDREAASSRTWKQLEMLRSSAPMVDWLITFQSPAKEAAEHAIAEWRRTSQLDWLAAALTKARGQETASEDLIKAAEEIKPDSPASEMMTYHRIRLLIESGNAEQARAELAQIMPQIQAGRRASSINQFLGLRARTATNLSEYLAYTPRNIIERTSEEENSVDECIDVMKDPKRSYACIKDVDTAQFSDDATHFFNEQASMAELLKASRSEVLPAQLRNSVAMMARVRTVLMKDDAAAAKLLPLLPEKLQGQAGGGTGFRALLAIARNPGLRPYLDPGIQRSYSWDFVQSYGDNWWCSDWQNSPYSTPQRSTAESPSFLTGAEAGEVTKELALLHKNESAEIWLGSEILEHARTHGDDPEVPESLYLVLRMIRYGCDRIVDYSPEEKTRTNKLQEMKSEAARILRRRYATSEWTKKAGPISG